MRTHSMLWTDREVGTTYLVTCWCNAESGFTQVLTIDEVTP